MPHPESDELRGTLAERVEEILPKIRERAAENARGPPTYRRELRGPGFRGILSRTCAQTVWGPGERRPRLAAGD